MLSSGLDVSIPESYWGAEAGPKKDNGAIKGYREQILLGVDEGAGVV